MVTEPSALTPDGGLIVTRHTAYKFSAAPAQFFPLCSTRGQHKTHNFNTPLHQTRHDLFSNYLFS